MSSSNPIDLLFGGMEKLGPGSNSDTLKVLGMLPMTPYQVIVDAGCGAGRHTLALVSQAANIGTRSRYLRAILGQPHTTRKGGGNRTPCSDTLHGHG